MACPRPALGLCTDFARQCIRRHSRGDGSRVRGTMKAFLAQPREPIQLPLIAKVLSYGGVPESSSFLHLLPSWVCYEWMSTKPDRKAVLFGTAQPSLLVM